LQGFYPNEPLVRPFAGRPGEWKLVETFGYVDSGGTVTRREASEKNPFVFDFASVPRFAWVIVGPPGYGKTRRPATIHDIDYRQQSCSKAEADWRFLDAMEFAGVFWLKRIIFYQAVVRFGGKAWEQNRRALEHLTHDD
jgi:hypothetical protein